MAVAITITGVRRTGGKLYITFSDNEEREYESRRDAKQVNRAIMDDQEVASLLKSMLICKGLRRNSDAVDDLDTLVGKKITLDMTLAANIVRVT